jgi:WD40 repeat protein
MKYVNSFLVFLLAAMIPFFIGCGNQVPAEKKGNDVQAKKGGKPDAKGKKESDSPQKDDDLASKKKEEKVVTKKAPVLSAGDTIKIQVENNPESLGLGCTADGKTLVASEPGRSMKLIQVDKKITRAIEEHISKGLVMAPGGTWFAGYGSRGGYFVYELPSGKALRHLENEKSAVDPLGVSLSPNGDLLVATNGEKLVGFDPIKGAVLFSQGMKPTCVSCALFPDKSLVATGHLDGTVKIWDMKSWKVVKEIPTKKDNIASVTRLAVSSDGKFMAVGGEYKRIKIYNLKKDFSVRELKDFSERNPLYFIPGRNLLACKSLRRDLNCDIALIDPETGEDKAILQGHEKKLPNLAGNEIWGMTATADGSTLFSLCGRGEIKIWDLKKLP